MIFLIRENSSIKFPLGCFAPFLIDGSQFEFQLKEIIQVAKTSIPTVLPDSNSQCDSFGGLQTLSVRVDNNLGFLPTAD